MSSTFFFGIVIKFCFCLASGFFLGISPKEISYVVVCLSLLYVLPKFPPFFKDDRRETIRMFHRMFFGQINMTAMMKIISNHLTKKIDVARKLSTCAYAVDLWTCVRKVDPSQLRCWLCWTIFSLFSSVMLQKPTIIFIIIIFLHGLVRLTCSGIDAFPSFCGPQWPYGLFRRELYVPGRASQAGQAVREGPDYERQTGPPRMVFC